MPSDRVKLSDMPLGRLHCRGEFPAETALRAIHSHTLALKAGGSEVVKHSRKSNVTIVETAEGPLCVKEFVRNPLLLMAPFCIRHRSALTSWRSAFELNVRGIPAPAAPAVLLGNGKSSYLFMEAVKDAEPLHAYVRHKLPVSRKRAFLHAAALSLHKMYASKVLHKDLKTSNVLVRESANGWEFVLLDLAAVRFPIQIGTNRMLLNMAQLGASMPLQITWTDRLRILRLLSAHYPALAPRKSWSKIRRITLKRECVWARPYTPDKNKGVADGRQAIH